MEPFDCAVRKSPGLNIESNRGFQVGVAQSDANLKLNVCVIALDSSSVAHVGISAWPSVQKSTDSSRLITACCLRREAD
jgi:hypothetical protein